MCNATLAMQQRSIAVKLNKKVIKIKIQTVTNLMMFNVQNVKNYMGLFFLLANFGRSGPLNIEYALEKSK